MIAFTSLPQKQSTLYLFKFDDVPLEATLTPEHRREMQNCLRRLRTALLVSSKTEAMHHLKTTVQIARTLETVARESPAFDCDRTTAWCLANQENHIDVQATYVNHPLQCLIVNVVSAYQALVDSTTDVNFTSPTAQAQRYGLLDCVGFLSRVLKLSVEVS